MDDQIMDRCQCFHLGAVCLLLVFLHKHDSKAVHRLTLVSSYVHLSRTKPHCILQGSFGLQRPLICYFALGKGPASLMGLLSDIIGTGLHGPVNWARWWVRIRWTPLLLKLPPSCIQTTRRPTLLSFHSTPCTLTSTSRCFWSTGMQTWLLEVCSGRQVVRFSMLCL